MAFKRALLNHPYMVMGRSQVKEETKERRERGRSIGSQSPRGKVPDCRRSRVLGTGGGLAYRKQTPVSMEGGRPGHPGCRKVSGWGGWKEGGFLRTSTSAVKEYAGQRPRVWGFREEVLL